MFWTIIIRTQRINVFCENFNKLQESTVFHDHETINTLTNMMNWILVTIWFQDHVLIWQARSEIWCADMIITRFAHKYEWSMNHELILNFIIFRMIWEDMTCFHESWTQWRESQNQ